MSRREIGTDPVVAATDDTVGFIVEGQASHKFLVPFQHVQAFAGVDVPNANGAIVPTRNASVAVPSEAGKTAAVAFESSNDSASRKVPKSASRWISQAMLLTRWRDALETVVAASRDHLVTFDAEGIDRTAKVVERT